MGIGSRVDVLDIADAARTHLTGSSPPLPGTVRGLAVDGLLGVAALGTDGIAVLDFTAPDGPNVAASLALPGSAEAVGLGAHTAYVADGPAGVSVIDLSDPRSPRLVGTVLENRLARSISVTKGFAYVATGGGGIVPLDLADPRKPVPGPASDRPRVGLSRSCARRG